MKNNLDDRIDECFADFEHYWNLKAYYVSVGNLGEIVEAIPYLPKSCQIRCIQRLKKIKIPTAAAKAIKAELSSNREYILRMLSIPDTLIYEEILLILVKRREVESIKNFLDEYGPFRVEIDFKEADDLIDRELKCSRLNNDFNLALRSTKKNARLPINDY